MGKMIIHKSISEHLKIDGTCIDDKVKELEIDAGNYDIVAGTDCDSAYNTERYNQGSKSDIIWGMHEKVTINDEAICHVYVKRKFSLTRIEPIIKIKYK